VTDNAIPTPDPHVANFEKLAFGMFIHWGLYSQMAKGEWIQHIGNIDVGEYEKLKDTFTAEDFDARAIARLAKDAGMKYITITSRHHDGFSLYDTCGLNEYDAPHSAAGRDLIAEFVDGCRAEDITPFLYHTTLDWHWEGSKTPDLDEDKFNEYLDYLLASVETVCKNYGPLGGLWFDGNWSRRDSDWKYDRLYKMIRSYQPDAMIIDNTGLGEQGKVAHPMIDSVTFEQHAPGGLDRRGHERYFATEMCQTINGHWGIGSLDFAHKSTGRLIEQLAQCRSVGANYLLNVGPTAGGAIPPLESELMRTMGKWIEVNGEAVYEAKPVPIKCQGRDAIVSSGDKYYYIVYDLSSTGDTNVTVTTGGRGPRSFKGLDKPIKQIKWLDSGEELNFTQNVEAEIASIDFTWYPYGVCLVVRVAEITFE
jgi:alpha-L-fucosidase